MSDMSDVVIGEGVSISGEIKNAQTVVINGTADVTVAAEQIIVGATGQMKGKVSAQLVEVEGTLEGIIDSSTLCVRSTGAATGTISYQDVEIEIGGRILGELSNVSQAPSAPRKKGKKATANEGEEG